MKKFVVGLSSKVNRACKILLIACFVFAFVAAVYQVFSRFVLQSSFVQNLLPMIDFSIFNLSWIEEFIRYMFVWIVFLGIGMVYKDKGHAHVEILHHYLPPKFKSKLTVLIEVINSAAFLFLIIYGWRILKFTSQQISPSMGINMVWIYCSVLVCSLICLLHALVHVLELSNAQEAKVETIQTTAVDENSYLGHEGGR
ncbi:TRAP transporter small permease [Neobacillus muris]|uniref:TRAP transporter small permease n=1 Tax=Neobacillus muris TaxID=2941334 RepID=UPI00203FF120|nr:TRAP transporter small permease [Neobacillus muris]